MKDFRKQARQLIKVGKLFYKRGWVPTTSGNFSARVDDENVVITVSNKNKGKLTEEDIILINMQGVSLNSDKMPSAETALHTALYRSDPTINAVLHTHSVNATVLSIKNREPLQFIDYEVLKAFPDITTHETTVTIPVFLNDQDTTRLANVVQEYRQHHPDLLGYLIAGHGFYTWGNSVEDAQKHIEAFEFLFECELTMWRMWQ